MYDLNRFLTAQSRDYAAALRLSLIHISEPTRH